MGNTVVKEKPPVISHSPDSGLKFQISRQEKTSLVTNSAFDPYVAG
jgi:hypothetical protein